MNKLSQVFQNKKAFIGFVVAGDPSFEATVDNVIALAEGGADIVEIGLPFSDPVADGPVIQEADLRAFAAGMNTDKVFELVKKIREKTQVPLVFLTYLNLVFKYGYQNFCAKCQALEVSGLIIPDMPYEEKGELEPIAKENEVALIPLVAPTSGDRVEKIARDAQGFIYVVSSLGITGTRNTFAKELEDVLKQIKKVTNTPTAIGFGVHTPKQAKELGKLADGVIVGSEIVKIIKDNQPDATKAIKEYTAEMKKALHSI